MNVQVFGIRHHGPGSTRSLLAALEQLAPDCVLIEGPPEGEQVVEFLAHAEMRPPVALLIYANEDPSIAAFWPFAEFSPEYQAILYALRRQVPVRMMDLPQTHGLARWLEKKRGTSDESAAAAAPRVRREKKQRGDSLATATPEQIRADPIRWLAAAAGYADSERWWEQVVEARRGADPQELFAAIAEAMAAVRATAEPKLEFRGNDEDGESAGTRVSFSEADDPAREAFMRRSIRAAIKEGRERIAVVCGAWHAPALQLDEKGALPVTAKTDDATIRGLPKAKVTATWVPWTNARLSAESGYGAGIDSPGYYKHLWRFYQGRPLTDPDEEQRERERRERHALPKSSKKSATKRTKKSAQAVAPTALTAEASTATPNAAEATPVRTSERLTSGWLTRVAHLLRGEDLQAPPASVVEAVRLAEALAAMRALPVPGLAELDEATLAVLCGGDPAPLRLIRERLIIGSDIGQVPASTPRTPLREDLAREQRRLRLPAEADERILDLDLRKPNDLARSHMLHRLALLGIKWGELEEDAAEGALGTFHEIWSLRWDPEMEVDLVEASRWGTTLAAAGTACAVTAAERATTLQRLAEMIDHALTADLPAALPPLLARLQERSATAADVPQLMDALPALARVMRYGSVRRTDAALLRPVIISFLERIFIGLPAACASLDDEAAADMERRINRVHTVVPLLGEVADLKLEWHAALLRLVDQESLHGLIAGRAARILLDDSVLTSGEISRRLGLALSLASDAARAGAWVEGFLRGSGLVLLVDDRLWAVIDQWLAVLSPQAFDSLLPILRRTFSSFAAGERRQIGEKARQNSGGILRLSGDTRAPRGDDNFDPARADLVMPTILQILGIEK